MIYKFSYKEHNFEIEVKKEKTVIVNEIGRTEKFIDTFSFSCDKQLNYSTITKSHWKVTSVELKNKLNNLYTLIKKHYTQLGKNDTDLNWDSFVALLPTDFRENYLERFL
jgi:hypothetical protein